MPMPLTTAEAAPNTSPILAIGSILANRTLWRSGRRLRTGVSCSSFSRAAIRNAFTARTVQLRTVKIHHPFAADQAFTVSFTYDSSASYQLSASQAGVFLKRRDRI